MSEYREQFFDRLAAALAASQAREAELQEAALSAIRALKDLPRERSEEIEIGIRAAITTLILARMIPSPAAQAIARVLGAAGKWSTAKRTFRGAAERLSGGDQSAQAQSDWLTALHEIKDAEERLIGALKELP